MAYAVVPYGFYIFPAAMLLQHAYDLGPLVVDFIAAQITGSIVQSGIPHGEASHETQQKDQQTPSVNTETKDPQPVKASQRFFLTFATRVLALGAMARVLCCQGPVSLHNWKSVIILHTLLAFSVIGRETKFLTMVSASNLLDLQNWKLTNGRS